ncbi:MAG: two-component system response regulator [Planctomycetota bacterium]|nr:MAG: two-component system response regulator [Planctomycetota bacterium]
MSISILIVDDEKTITESLSLDLRFDGYEVVTANSGTEAIEVLYKKKIDIIISDIMMPNMNGLELLKRVRSGYPMIRVIMMTGYVRLSYALECMQLHADTIIFKPFHDLKELKTAVEEAEMNLRKWQTKLKLLQNMKTD